MAVTEEALKQMFPEMTDGVTVIHSHARNINQHYALELEYRNAEDLAGWLLEHNLTPDQHQNLISMLKSNDEESRWLALEIIKAKQQQLNETRSSSISTNES